MQRAQNHLDAICSARQLGHWRCRMLPSYIRISAAKVTVLLSPTRPFVRVNVGPFPQNLADVRTDPLLDAG